MVNTNKAFMRFSFHLSTTTTVTEISYFLLDACLKKKKKIIPEVIDHIGHTEERQDKGTGPAVALPDEVAARISSLAQTLLCNGSV